MFPHLQCSVKASKKVLWHHPILWSAQCYLKGNGLLYAVVSKVTKPRVTEWCSNIFMSISYIKHWTVTRRPCTHNLNELPLAYLPNQINLSYQVMQTKVFIYGSSGYWLHSYIYIRNPYSGVKWKSLSHAQLFATPWTTVHGILQARILEWVAFLFTRRSSQPRDRTQVSHIAGRFFTNWAIREACGTTGKESVHNAGDLDSIPGLERSLGEGKGYPFHYSGLEDSMDV